jgi:hypothetical protein
MQKSLWQIPKLVYLLNYLAFACAVFAAVTELVTTVNFNQQYQTLNTATNTLRASYEEQVRILEVAWQNQLTVVTDSVTAALPRLVDFAMPPQGLLCGSVPHSLP